MRRIIFERVLVIMVLIFSLLSTSCQNTTNPIEESKVPMKEFYNKDDFQTVVIGESTYYDVYDIAPSIFMQVTSYGGFCEYPIQENECLRIKFYGKELIVGAIEVVPSSEK